MRKWIVGLVAVGVAACAGQEKMPADLREDLASISSTSVLELASSPSSGALVVSTQEQTAPRVSAPAPATRAPQPRPSPVPRTQAAPRPQPEPQYDQSEIASVQPAVQPQPAENRGFDGMGEEAILTGRPQVVDAAPGPVARGGGGGSDVGTILAGIGIAVIRGGVVVGDVHCPPPRRRARGGGLMALPNQSGTGGVTVRGITIR